jgi:hypothetical protein
MSSCPAKMRLQPRNGTMKNGRVRSEMSREEHETRVWQRKGKSGCLAVRGAIHRGFLRSYLSQDDPRRRAGSEKDIVRGTRHHSDLVSVWVEKVYISIDLGGDMRLREATHPNKFYEYSYILTLLPACNFLTESSKSS